MKACPGQAWETGHPIVLTAVARLLRSSAPQPRKPRADLRALPCPSLSVTTSASVTGDLLWRRPGRMPAPSSSGTTTPSKSKDMTLVDGYYGTTGDTFEFISRRTSFRAGTGLPGLAWDSRPAGVPARSGRGSALSARRQRREGGHQPRLGLPCASADGEHYVLAFLLGAWPHPSRTASMSGSPTPAACACWRSAPASSRHWRRTRHRSRSAATALNKRCPRRAHRSGRTDSGVAQLQRARSPCWRRAGDQGDVRAAGLGLTL